MKLELFSNRSLNFNNRLLTDNRTDSRQSRCGMRYVGGGSSLCSAASDFNDLLVT